MKPSCARRTRHQRAIAKGSLDFVVDDPLDEAPVDAAPQIYGFLLQRNEQVVAAEWSPWPRRLVVSRKRPARTIRLAALLFQLGPQECLLLLQVLSRGRSCNSREGELASESEHYTNKHVRPSPSAWPFSCFSLPRRKASSPAGPPPRDDPATSQGKIVFQAQFAVVNSRVHLSWQKGRLLLQVLLRERPAGPPPRASL